MGYFKRAEFWHRTGSTVAVTLAAALGAGCSDSPGESLTVVSWGGAYAQAVSKGYIEPFMAKTGIEVRLERGPPLSCARTMFCKP